MSVQDIEVLVVGGGIMGVCTAYYLRQLGHEVGIVERKTIEAEASGRTAGSIALQNKRLHLVPLCIGGIKTWKELKREVSGLEFTASGGFRVAETEEDVRILDRDLPVQNELGLDIRRLAPREVRDMAPYLSRALKAVNFCPWDSHINALGATKRIADRSKQQGVEIFCRTLVKDIRWRSRDLVEVDAGHIRFRCRTLVLTAGVWTEKLAGRIGVRIPLRLRINQMIVTPRVPRVIGHMITHARGILTLKQLACGSILIGGGWQGRGDLNHDEKKPAFASIVGNAAVAVRVVPALARIEAIRTWAGFESRTDDEYPVIGALEGKENVLVGTSCIGGYVAGPYIGKLLAQVIHEGKSEMSLAPFFPGRFR